MQNALKHFRKSLQILPKNADASLKLAQVFEMLQQRDSAKYYYQQTVVNKPQYYIGWDNLGAMWANEGKFDSALHCFNQAYIADSTQEMTLLNLMVAHINLNHPNEAELYGKKALDLGYTNPKISELMKKVGEMRR